MNYSRNFQARAAMIQDNIRRKLIRNSNSLIGMPQEVIAIKTTNTREGDIESRIVEESFTANVVFPPLIGIPVRCLERKKDDVWTITSLVNAHSEENTEKYLVMSDKTLHFNDIICRTFLMDMDNKGDDCGLGRGCSGMVNVLCLEVSEVLADFGGNSVINKQYKTVLYTQELPQELINVIVDYAIRRHDLRY
jgi:hypothetical protein